jgi:molecular chaperone GrpE
MVKRNDPTPEKDTQEPDAVQSEEISSDLAHPKQVTITDEELRHLQKELLDYKDKYLRVLADSENARKRMQKERQEVTKYAVEGIAVDFLRPIDNLENALKFAQDMSDEVKNWAFGFQMILSQFKDILAENGIHPIESMGTAFDPHTHEAVEILETDAQPAGTVIEEYVRGYKMGDRTIRPARVKVTKAPQPDSEPEITE